MSFLFRCTCRIIHFFPAVPQLIFTATCLIWNPAGRRIACKDVIRSWRAGQLRTGRRLHYCVRVSDGWHRWQTRRINWRGYEKETGLRYGSAGVSRCIFSQMSCYSAVCGARFQMLKAARAEIGLSDDISRITPEEFDRGLKEETLLFGWLWAVSSPRRLMVLIFSWWSWAIHFSKEKLGQYLSRSQDESPVPWSGIQE